ncbi:MAG TPA: putative quinol monooxygenase [Candidatus Tumulicola sp.]|jgi:quinol monooxygenase YgiN
MLIQSIHYEFAPEDADRVEELFRELRDASRKQPGVIQFDVARSKEHPERFVLWEVYVDEAALAAHQQTEHFKRLAIGGVRPLAKNRLAENAVPI